MTYDEYRTESLKILNEARKYIHNFARFQIEMSKLDTLCEAYKKDILEGIISCRDSTVTYSISDGNGKYYATGLSFSEAEEFICNSPLRLKFEICPDKEGVL